jgi:hypothetical protein
VQEIAFKQRGKTKKTEAELAKTGPIRGDLQLRTLNVNNHIVNEEDQAVKLWQGSTSSSDGKTPVEFAGPLRAVSRGMSLSRAYHDTPRDESETFDWFNILSSLVLGIHLELDGVFPKHRVEQAERSLAGA